MNFDFLKNLRGLGTIYENCNNAEKLAMTMPVQSVFTARKSAELLAKFIYLAAHNEQIEFMSFADILSDPVVCEFIHNRRVMNAFHFIRKSGNRAVHGDEEESPDEAIDVLEDLHFVAGETACMLGLIDSYPAFEEHVTSFPEAQYVDEKDIDKKAQKMFLAYVEKYNAQVEHDKYIEMKDYDWLTYTVEGNVEMHEYLAFKAKPNQRDIVDFLQNYLKTLLRLSIERAPEKAIELKLDYPVTLDVTLTIGQEQYTSYNAERFIAALNNALPGADKFTIDLTCSGVLKEFLNDELDENGNGRINMIRKDAAWTGAGMLDVLLQYKRRNAFEYKIFAFYPDSGNFLHEAIKGGREINIQSLFEEQIVQKNFDEEWWSGALNLYVDFDLDKYPNQIKKLHEIVRAFVPQSEIQYCENAWDDGDNHILCNSIQWNCHCLRKVQDFLDKINEVILPIKEDVDIVCDGLWQIQSCFAIATWDWTEDGFKITGTVL